MRVLVAVAVVCTFVGVVSAQQKSADKPKPAADKGKAVDIKVPPLPPSTEDLLMADLAGAAWVSAEIVGYPKGAMMALIGQDPVSTGMTVFFKVPAGFKIPKHWHTHTEYLTLVAGKATVTVDGKAHPMAVGSYVVFPSKLAHELVCDAGAECVIINRRSGPTDVNWVNAPSK
jgi:quercetin dioxygenase-like cupin family protein